MIFRGYEEREKKISEMLKEGYSGGVVTTKQSTKTSLVSSASKIKKKNFQKKYSAQVPQKLSSFKVSYS